MKKNIVNFLMFPPTILLFIGGFFCLINPQESNPYVQEAWIPIALGIASLAMSAYQGYESSRQAKKAEELASTPTPEQKMPPQMKQALATSGYLAGLSQAPGSVYERAYAEEKAAQMYDQGLDVTRTGGQAQGILENKYANLAEEQRLRESNNLNFQVAMKQNDVQTRLQAADMQYKLDTTNIMEPYYRKMAASSALREASEANKWGAMNNAVSSFSLLAGQFKGKGAGAGATTTPPVAGKMGADPSKGIGTGKFTFGYSDKYKIGSNPSGATNPYAAGYYQYNKFGNNQNVNPNIQYSNQGYEDESYYINN